MDTRRNFHQMKEITIFHGKNCVVQDDDSMNELLMKTVTNNKI